MSNRLLRVVSFKALSVYYQVNLYKLLINQTKTINLIVYRVAANLFCALQSEDGLAALSIRDKKIERYIDMSFNFTKSLSAEDFL